MLPGKLRLPTCTTRALQRLSQRDTARVGTLGRTNFQSFQPLEKEGYNERVIAMPLNARSAALLLMQIRPSSRNRINAVHRFSK